MRNDTEPVPAEDTETERARQSTVDSERIPEPLPEGLPEADERMADEPEHRDAEPPDTVTPGLLAPAMAAPGMMAPTMVVPDTDRRDEDTEDTERTDAESVFAERVDADTGTMDTGSAPAGMMPDEQPVEQVAALWRDDTATRYRDRLRDLQLRFVDSPRAAADEAAQLVGEVVDELTQALAETRADLDGWRSTQGEDTEQMRVVVRRYRDFLSHVLDL